MATIAVLQDHDPLPGDRATVEWVTERAGTGLDGVMRAIGLLGSAWVLAPLAAVLAFGAVARGDRRALLLVATGALLVWIVNPALKRVFERERPAVREFVEPTSRYSFPSGHAVASATFAAILVGLAWETRWRRPVLAGAVGYVVAVGVSRLVLGVHYPSDLVAGWALGLAAMATAATLVRPSAPGSDWRDDDSG